MRTLLSVAFVLMVSFTGVVQATHFPLVETAECSERNYWCGQTLGHTEGLYHAGEQQKASDKQHTCLAQMEDAMRVMDNYIPSFVDPAERRRMNNSHILMDDFVCRGLWCRAGIEYHDTRSIEERLADDRRRYEREQEALGKQIVGDQRERFAYQQWATVKKECWSQP